VKLDLILKGVLTRLEDAKVTLGAIRVLSGEFLDSKNIMGEHYGVISSISKKGVAVVAESSKKKLEELYAKELKAGAKIVGGHQLLAEEKNLDAFALRVLNDNLGTQRLGGGTYAFKLQVLGVNYIVLNPFHPYQLVPYTTKGHAIIVFEGKSTVPWAELRTSVCGVTDPAAAASGSIRQMLLASKTEFGLADVNKSSNGCHMSAGPLEGLVELKRFFEVNDDSKTSFGALLAQKGLSAAQITHVSGNPDLVIGEKSISAFDATEELDSEVAATKLASATPSKI